MSGKTSVGVKDEEKTEAPNTVTENAEKCILQVHQKTNQTNPAQFKRTDFNQTEVPFWV